ncbi:MAG: GTPase ObgE [Bacilli bacterium]|nr:GTPase ObgE [Bacilli bacterium]
MFVDEVKLKVIAGAGGDGCTAFRREKFVPNGGPDGGNGGKGSNIIFTVDKGLRTLLDLKYKKEIKGKRGEHGSGKNQYGKNAEDVIIKVPEGTTVTDLETGMVIADLINEEDTAVIAYGGRGGRGNKAFATPTNPAPDISEHGEPGEERNIKVELKMLADVGLVGLPSVGKSTILSQVSRANPKIAAYHFTTLSPNLGVVKTKDNRVFVMADLPGLIEGASKGEGLGDKFLRHIERTRVICHVIDMSGSEGRNPYEDYLLINKELEEFSPKLLNKKQVIIANKMDLDSSKENLKLFKEKVKLPVYEVSAMMNIGLDVVITHLADILDEVESEPLYQDSQIESHVLYKFKKEKPFTITKDNNAWVVRGDTVEKLFKMTKFNSNDATLRFAKKLKNMGIDEELKKMGANSGDTVRIMDYEFTYID